MKRMILLAIVVPMLHGCPALTAMLNAPVGPTDAQLAACVKIEMDALASGAVTKAQSTANLASVQARQLTPLCQGKV